MAEALENAKQEHAITLSELAESRADRGGDDGGTHVLVSMLEEAVVDAHHAAAIHEAEHAEVAEVDAAEMAEALENAKQEHAITLSELAESRADQGGDDGGTPVLVSMLEEAVVDAHHAAAIHEAEHAEVAEVDAAEMAEAL